MLAIRGLELSYGEEPVLSGLDLAVNAGEFVSLIVLRAITGLQAPSDGAISLDVDPEHVAFLFQDDALLPWRTARANVALGLRIRGVAKATALERADTWLERLGLAGLGDRYPRELSGGQRKRVALAQILSLQPRLLLMDEPFSSLDAIVRHRLTEDLLDWVERERLTVLLVTHDLEEAISLSDRVLLLSGGPRARVVERYDVPLPRPRDLLAAKTHPTFGPLLRTIWEDLEREVSPAMVQR